MKRRRRITIRFDISDEKALAPLWEACKSTADPVLGMHPTAVSWGDMFAELRAMESRYTIAKKLLRRGGDTWEILHKLERLESIIPMHKVRENL